MGSLVALGDGHPGATLWWYPVILDVGHSVALRWVPQWHWGGDILGH